MAPTAAVADTCLGDAIDAYAEAGDFESAIWWSERLYAVSPSLENLIRLANCNLQSGGALRAYGLLKSYQPGPGATEGGRTRQECRRRHLFARICFQLGRLQEAELALLENVPAGGKPSAVDPELGGPSGLYLLGKICLKQSRRSQAAAYFHRCLDLDRRHWAAYAALCQMGMAQPGSCHLDGDCGDVLQPPRSSPHSPPGLLSPCPNSATASELTTPLPRTLALFDDSADETPFKMAPIPFRKPPLGSIRKGHSRLVRDSPGMALRMPRRSERLQFTLATPEAAPVLPPPTALAERGLNRATSRRAVKRGKSETVGAGVASARAATLAQSVTLIAAAYRHLYLFECLEAIDTFQRLPESQFQSPWVLAHVARAHFELNDYAKACDAFERARRLDPYNLAGVEIYSTALWQLKQEIKLAFLAQQTLEMTRVAPEAWIAIGNCFSLQKEHDLAVRFFQRATALDPDRAYAYTLMAHEYIANEDFDKAMTGFRNAIRIDERHYNAWYGLGTIYYRQEKYDLAAHHFLRAIRINPRNSVLECYLGIVLHAAHKLDDALAHLDRSCALEPANLLPKFQKANVLFSMEQYDGAMLELEQLADVAPREASVHFLMGRICKKRGDLVGALLRFSTCLDLDPKDRNLVKASIEKLHAVSAGGGGVADLQFTDDEDDDDGDVEL